MTPIVVPDGTKSISCMLTVGDLTLTKQMDTEPTDLITYYKEDSYFIFVIHDSVGAVKNKNYMLCGDNTPSIVLDYSSSVSSHREYESGLVPIVSWAVPNTATVITTIPVGVNTIYLWAYPKYSCLREIFVRTSVSSGDIITVEFNATSTIFYCNGVFLKGIDIESVAAEVSYDATLINEGLN